jgi:hypothetical protein
MDQIAQFAKNLKISVAFLSGDGMMPGQILKTVGLQKNVVPTSC